MELSMLIMGQPAWIIVLPAIMIGFTATLV